MSHSAEYLRGIEDAARIADMYAVENFRLATDTVLIDPVLRGCPDVAGTSENLMWDGCIHSSMAHAAQNIAAAIREVR